MVSGGDAIPVEPQQTHVRPGGLWGFATLSLIDIKPRHELQVRRFNPLRVLFGMRLKKKEG